MKLALTDETGRVVGYRSGTPEALAAWVDNKKPAELGIAIAETAAKLDFAKPQTINTVRQQRNKLLAKYQWTVGLDSPLTKQNQADWLRYLKALHKVTKKLDDPAMVVWPVEPELIYEES